MRYKIHFEDEEPILIDNVDWVEVREGVYLFYDKDSVLLYAVRVKDVCAMGAIDVIKIEERGE